MGRTTPEFNSIKCIQATLSYKEFVT